MPGRRFDFLSSWLPILLGLGALLLLGISGLGLTDSLTDRWILGLLLTVVSVLAVSAGIERWVMMNRIESKIDGIQVSVAAALGGVYLEGPHDIWAHSLGTITNMSSSLVSVVVGTGPRAPKQWNRGVLGRLRDTARAGNKATWDVYLQAPAEFQLPQEAYSRFADMWKAGVLDQFQLWHVPFEEHSGFDFFVIDSRHVYLTIPAKPGLPDPHRAIFFREAPDLAQQLTVWLGGLPKTRIELPTFTS